MTAEAQLDRSYPLAEGPRVRLRLPRTADAPAIRELHERDGLFPSDLELARLVRFDERERIVICATALLGAREVVVGIAAQKREASPEAVPETLVVEPKLADQLEELLGRALRTRAQALGRRHAA